MKKDKTTYPEGMSRSVNLDLIPKIAETNPKNAILMIVEYLKLKEFQEKHTASAGVTEQIGTRLQSEDTRVQIPSPAPGRLRCIFCNRRIPKGGNRNDVLHHTIPICVSKTYGWLHNKEIPGKTKELISKSRLPLCPKCHGKFHNITLPLISLIQNKDEDLSIPPAEFVFILQGVNTKFGVRREMKDRGVRHMYRCFYCKDPVTMKEHRRVKAEIGPIIIDEDDGFFPDDHFDGSGSAVVCQNCVDEVEIEVERLLEVK